MFCRAVQPPYGRRAMLAEKREGGQHSLETFTKRFIIVSLIRNLTLTINERLMLAFLVVGVIAASMGKTGREDSPPLRRHRTGGQLSDGCSDAEKRTGTGLPRLCPEPQRDEGQGAVFPLEWELPAQLCPV